MNLCIMFFSPTFHSCFHCSLGGSWSCTQDSSIVHHRVCHVSNHVLKHTGA